MNELQTERLTLRRVRQDDHAAYARLNADPEVMRYLNGGKPLTAGESWRTLAMLSGHWELRGFGPYAVVLRSSGEMIGHLGLWYPEGWPDIEIGFRLARPFWGQGLATEGAVAVVEHAFNDLGLSSLCSVIHPDNFASQRVAEKLGLVRSHSWSTGGIDVLVYARSRVPESISG